MLPCSLYTHSLPALLRYFCKVRFFVKLGKRLIFLALSLHLWLIKSKPSCHLSLNCSTQNRR